MTGRANSACTRSYSRSSAIACRKNCGTSANPLPPVCNWRPSAGTEAGARESFGRENPGRQVTVSAIAYDGDDRCILCFRADLQGRPQRAPRGYAGKNALFACKPPRHLLRICLRNFHDAVDTPALEDARHISFRPLANAGDLRTFGGLTAHDRDGGIAFLEITRTAH